MPVSRARRCSRRHVRKSRKNLGLLVNPKCVLNRKTHASHARCTSSNRRRTRSQRDRIAHIHKSPLRRDPQRRHRLASKAIKHVPRHRRQTLRIIGIDAEDAELAQHPKLRKLACVHRRTTRALRTQLAPNHQCYQRIPPTAVIHHHNHRPAMRRKTRQRITRPLRDSQRMKRLAKHPPHIPRKKLDESLVIRAHQRDVPSATVTARSARRRVRHRL